jgi:dihydrofolate reductase
MKQLIGIVAMTATRTIGAGGTLPWHLPADLAFFKATTSGHPIVMGRKTFDSIGRPLPKRRNIILTRDEHWSHPGVEVIHQPQDLHAIAAVESLIYIIGGAEIYRAFMPQMTALLVTHVKQDYPGDTHFPAYEHDFPHQEILQENPDFTVIRHSRQVVK